jgi:predicted PurR-regulated permease PerM
MAVSSERAQSRLLSLATIIAVVSVLYFARDVLIPLAMAILVSFLLAPIVSRLQRLGMRRIPAVLTAVASASALGFVAVWIFLYQMVDLGEQLPKYKQNIAKKYDALHESFSPWLRRATEAIDDVNAKVGTGAEKSDPDASGNEQNSTHQPAVQAQSPPAIAEQSGTIASKAGVGNAKSPARSFEDALQEFLHSEQGLPVRIISGPSAFPGILNNLVGPVLAWFGTAAMIAVLAIFILIEREDLRNRFIRLIGDRQLHTTTEALDDASTRVSRYLLMQFIVNVTYGMSVSLGLWLIGSLSNQPIPNVAVWGLLATVLRFIPYIGPWIAATLPILLSLAISDGWVQPLLVIGLFVVLELLSNNVMEPMLYGSSTGISAFGIIISAVFWTWLWGAVGLVLATPLTVCLMVLGRHVPQFKYFEILLGDQPPLPFSASVYQRLLALDEDEVANTAKKYLHDHQLGELFDEVLVPALLLANQDHQQGRIDEARWHYIHDAIRELVVDLQEEAQKLAAKIAASAAKEAELETPADDKNAAPPSETKSAAKGRVFVHCRA